MFNLQPGQGLGKETSNGLAFGLGSWASAGEKIVLVALEGYTFYRKAQKILYDRSMASIEFLKSKLR